MIVFVGTELATYLAYLFHCQMTNLTSDVTTMFTPRLPSSGADMIWYCDLGLD